MEELKALFELKGHRYAVLAELGDRAVRAIARQFRWLVARQIDAPAFGIRTRDRPHSMKTSSR